MSPWGPEAGAGNGNEPPSLPAPLPQAGEGSVVQSFVADGRNTTFR
jgi:hypothetical protein